MKTIRKKEFANGAVYCLQLEDGRLIETTDTFLPFYTKDAIGRKQNTLVDNNLGSRSERWMIGVSVSSSCPIRCKFCATGQMKTPFRNLTAEEIVEQVDFVIARNTSKYLELSTMTYETLFYRDPKKSQEFKINYTRMGDFALNIDNVKKAIQMIDEKYPNTHHYLSTIGIKGTDFSWIKDNITLQISLHSFDENHRDWLIPYKNKMSIKELGEIRTKSNLKTTINLTLIDENDFKIDELKKYFDPQYFFVKLSPINVNEVSENNNCGKGIIESINIK